MTLYIHPDRSQWWSVDTVTLRMRLSDGIYGPAMYGSPWLWGFDQVRDMLAMPTRIIKLKTLE